MTPDVTHVATQEDYELLVTFSDGAIRRFSMLPYLQYPAYQLLQEPGKFKLACVLNGTVAWSDEIDMSPDTLYLAGRAIENNQVAIGC